MKWKIVWSEAFGKEFEKPDQRLRGIIYRKINSLENYPYLGKRLSHALAGFWVLKVSKYRIFYRLMNSRQTISVEFIESRSEALGNLRGDCSSQQKTRRRLRYK